jgi:hypothetical protein
VDDADAVAGAVELDLRRVQPVLDAVAVGFRVVEERRARSLHVDAAD